MWKEVCTFRTAKRGREGRRHTWSKRDRARQTEKEDVCEIEEDRQAERQTERQKKR